MTDFQASGAVFDAFEAAVLSSRRPRIYTTLQSVFRGLRYLAMVVFCGKTVSGRRIVVDLDFTEETI